MSDQILPGSDEVRSLWEQKSDFWNEMFGADGNLFHRTLIEPTVDRLIAPQAGEHILDAGCGNGVYARHLAKLGVNVTAFDFSARFIELAQARDIADGLNIDYHVIDATDEAALNTLGEARFDAIVCNMALQDISDIDPLSRAIRRLLKPGGRFVFSITHPCFNHTGVRMSIEEDDRDGQLVEVKSLKIINYLDPYHSRGVGAIGEPAPHYYFHRPLHVLLGAFFRAGLAVDDLAEPAFAPDTPSKRILSWTNYSQIPPVMVARLCPI